MSGPFIFIATDRLREGKLGAERVRAAELTSFTEANEPQLIALSEYHSDQVHLSGLAERFCSG